MTIAFFIGRLIFGGFWLINAKNHLLKANALAGYAKSKNVPAPKVAVIGSGILALIGGVSIVLGLWTLIGVIALVVFLLGVTFKMHAYWNETDVATRTMQKIQFQKNMALLGAALMMLAISTPWMWSV